MARNLPEKPEWETIRGLVKAGEKGNTLSFKKRINDLILDNVGLPFRDGRLWNEIESKIVPNLA